MDKLRNIREIKYYPLLKQTSSEILYLMLPFIKLLISKLSHIIPHSADSSFAIPLRDITLSTTVQRWEEGEEEEMICWHMAQHRTLQASFCLALSHLFILYP